MRWRGAGEGCRQHAPSEHPAVCSLLCREYVVAYCLEKPVQIICATASAAAHVLQLLLAAQLQPARDFEISPILAITPPITYTLLIVVPAPLARKIRATADTTVVE
jgi:hypothetical protein